MGRGNFMKYYSPATIKSGQLKIRYETEYNDWPKNQKDGDYVLEIYRKNIKRSGQQNNYYWGVVLETISESIGHTSEELHEIFKRKFLPPQIVTYRGKEIKMPNTTTKLSTIQFSEYLAKIFIEAGELGISIP